MIVLSRRVPNVKRRRWPSAWPANWGSALDQVRGSGPGGRITVDDVRRLAEKPLAPPLNASPKARLLAKERGIDLTGLTGTGVDGMVIVRDVVAAPWAETAAVPLTKLRRVIAARTQASKQTIPHFYLMVDVDMTQANALRAYCHDRAGWPRPPTYTDILIRVCALTLAEMPEYNRSYSETGLSARDRVGVGVAVSTDDGLVVPVIPEANRLSLAQVSASLRELAARARAGRLRPDDLGEKSLVISNLGMYSVDAFIAIIDMPDPMILAVGQVADRVVPVAGQVAIRPMCTLSLSVDHRVFDGVQGARFLDRIKDRLENPFDLMG
jgi:pyruvate dehydrogenase E2 component (dihydrolipoamide acetyltransferase)